jgi:hypothetical protein
MYAFSLETTEYVCFFIRSASSKSQLVVYNVDEILRCDPFEYTLILLQSYLKKKKKTIELLKDDLYVWYQNKRGFVVSLVI